MQGSHSNKVMEVYNPTDAVVDLTLYFIGHAVDGVCKDSHAGNAAEGPCDGATYTVPKKFKNLGSATPTLAPGETLTFCNKQAVIGANGNAKVDPTKCTIEAGDAAWFK